MPGANFWQASWRQLRSTPPLVGALHISLLLAIAIAAWLAPPAAMAYVAAILPFCAGALYWTGDTKRIRDFDQLIDRDAGAPQYIVNMTVRYGKLAYGEDLGVLSFIDGYLVFEGMRTSFSFSKNAAVRAPTYGDRSGQRRDIDLLSNGQILTLSLHAMPWSGRPGVSRPNDPVRDIDAWWSSAPSEARVEVLPPRTLSPQLITADLQLNILLGRALAPFIIALVIWSVRLEPSLGAGLTVGPVAILTCFVAAAFVSSQRKFARLIAWDQRQGV